MMKKASKVFLGVLIAGVLAVGWWLGSPLLFDRAVDEELPPTSNTSSPPDETDSVEEPVEDNETPEETDEMDKFTGNFMDGEKNYETSGTITSVEADEGLFLRFEDFQTTNGPDLFVYLIEPGMEVSDGINLGSLKGNTGNQNYLLPEDVDLTTYQLVVIWCRAFDATFGTGELMVAN